MLDPNELKVVVATLTKRRAWIKKTLEGNTPDPAVRAENTDMLKLLDSSILKLTSTAQPTQTLSPKHAPPSPSKVIPLERAKVLLAEDNEESAILLVDTLQDIGLKKIDVASDGIQAFDFIKKFEDGYDIILCDWEMPLLSGLEVHSKAKASNTLRGAHFIMVTAMSEASSIKKAVEQGISDYIVKPVDMDILEEKIRTALGLPTSKANQEEQ